MIREIYTGNKFERFISTALGFGSLHREYVVPDVLDHRILQPGGVSIHLEGPRDNLTVICDTPNGSFPFNAVLPEGTTFEINNSKFDSYKAIIEEGKILIPANRRQTFIPVFGILHEGGHIWRKEDKKWHACMINANELLRVQLFSRAIDGYVWLPKNPLERQQHLEAWRILGEEERRASAIALYTVGRLRAIGIDPLPRYPTAKLLTEIVNGTLKSHDQFKQWLRFTASEVAEFLDGSLPIPILGGKVASYLNKNLPTLAIRPEAKSI